MRLELLKIKQRGEKIQIRIVALHEAQWKYQKKMKNVILSRSYLCNENSSIVS